MDINCYSKGHENIKAISYCCECKVYMCNKCENFHLNLLPNHQSFNLDKNLDEIFTGYCKEKRHNNDKLEFFCKDHNILCCAACLCKIKKDEIGNHHDCDVCTIEDIKEEKINNLKKNIKYLEEIFNTLEESIKNIKIIYEKMNENKEELKLKIQKIFTKIRNELNNREDEILLEVDKKFEDFFIKEEIIKECGKLPDKIKISLDKGKLIEKEKNDNKLNLLINECITMENNIKSITIIQENIKKFNNLYNFEINFYPEEEGINSIVNTIKSFGQVTDIKNNHLLNISSILTKKEEEDLINSWVSPNKKISYELLFRATRDGDKVEDFHNHCDNKSPILILGKTPNNFIFGGYTSVILNYTKNEYIKDNNAFIFSLNQKKRFFSKDQYSTRSNRPDYFIIFGNGKNSLQIKDNILSSKHWSNPNGSYGDNLNLTEDKDFFIVEFEVFNIN